MRQYKYRMVDECGCVIGVQFSYFESFADAQAFTDTLMAEGKWARVELVTDTDPSIFDRLR